MGEGLRSLYLCVGNAVLYQMSYTHLFIFFRRTWYIICFTPFSYRIITYRFYSQAYKSLDLNLYTVHYSLNRESYSRLTVSGGLYGGDVGNRNRVRARSRRLSRPSKPFSSPFYGSLFITPIKLVMYSLYS